MMEGERIGYEKFNISKEYEKALKDQLGEQGFNIIKDYYMSLSQQEDKDSFLKSIIALLNKPELMDAFLRALKNPVLEEYEKGRSASLKKIEEILSLLKTEN